MIHLYSTEKLHEIAQSFSYELSETLAGTSTRLSYLKNPIPHISLVKDDEPFQIMVIGGSIFSTCIVSKIRGQQKLHTAKLPIFTDRSVFLEFIGQHLDSSVKTVAINFAYPLQPDVTHGILDGVLMRSTKEHSFTGLIGKKVGETITEYIKNKYRRTIQVTLANDTVCLLLSALSDNTNKNTIAGVIGTGTNYAITHDQSIINLESGNFNAFPQSETGVIVDRESNNPGQQTFEKEVAGAYLYKHYNAIISDKNQTLSSTEELNMRAQNSDEVAQRLLKHSAQLSASVLAGTAFFKKSQQIHNLDVIMEGSLYWNGFHYKETISDCLNILGVSNIRFKRIENQGVKGAIHLVTFNY